MDTKYLHELILKLSDKVEEIHNQIGNMQSTCKLRHSIDLKEQISLLRRDLVYIGKQIETIKFEKKTDEESINVLDKALQEIKASIDLIKIRITTIQNQSVQNKQKKYTFNKEIFIGIILIVLTTLITLIGNRIYDIMFNVEKQYENTQTYQRSSREGRPQHKYHKNK